MTPTNGRVATIMEPEAREVILANLHRSGQGE